MRPADDDLVNAIDDESTPNVLGTATLTHQGHHCPGSEVAIQCEVYLAPGGFAVHTICPRCLNAQWIDSARKSIEFDAETAALHIEPFECTWELGPERREFGVSLCRCRLAYAGHAIRDA